MDDQGEEIFDELKIDQYNDQD